ncbi:uncharacterized protein LOC122393225 [Amphibalanus amphitrite]|uniref:uncharacterized protein LOC122393225 n=1 Tax=Amphibalanus amphitrite TaxID=1232801 RepID=UPI001C916016|nr:uncharacterized protein LOC122393225 [Amphibalanus amphitrite]XP_043245000.1 uncharacterized protein LOC122393225 [Amphibalanus amphitrite]
MAAVLICAAPIFFVGLSAIFLDPDVIVNNEIAESLSGLPDTRGLYSPFGSSSGGPDGLSSKTLTADRILTEVLQSFNDHSETFLQHQALVDEFIFEATAHLPGLSPLFTNVTTHHDGSAFEGTRVVEFADFDTYIMLSRDVVLRYFELRRGEEGRISARLRPGISREELPADLERMVREDNYLDARRLKRWVFERLEMVLKLTARAHPQLRAAVYSTKGAAGVDLIAPDGARLEVDLAAQLDPPPMDGMVRPESTKPCGLELVSAGHPIPWSIYSKQTLIAPPHPTASGTTSGRLVASPTTSSPVWNVTRDGEAHSAYAIPGDDETSHWFVINSMQLERAFLSKQPQVRNVIRILKLISMSRSWKQRFGVDSFVLKHVAFWSFAEDCGTSAWSNVDELASAVVSSLRTFENALRRGRMDKFFSSPPADSVFLSLIGGQATLRLLADEVHGVSDVLLGDDQDAIRSILRIL